MVRSAWKNTGHEQNDRNASTYVSVVNRIMLLYQFVRIRGHQEINNV